MKWTLLLFFVVAAAALMVFRMVNHPEGYLPFLTGMTLGLLNLAGLKRTSLSVLRSKNKGVFVLQYWGRLVALFLILLGCLALLHERILSLLAGIFVAYFFIGKIYLMSSLFAERNRSWKM